jgi:hypothetical protein
MKVAARWRRDADYRSGATLAGVALCACLCVLASSPPASAEEVARASSSDSGPDTVARVTLALAPAGTTPRAMEEAGLSPGLMSAGLGTVPADQTYLDIGQGNRVFDSLYDEPLPRHLTLDGRVPSSQWRTVRERARSAPADILPGLLATAIAREGGFATAAGLTGSPGLPALVAANRAGRVRAATSCCPGEGPAARSRAAGLIVTSLGPSRLRELAARVSDDDLLIAIERPPPEEDGRQLALGIAGLGSDGRLTSDSTRLDGLVLSTDLAPTILERLGVEVPGEMSGSPIRTEGEADPEGLVALEERMAVIGERRGSVIGITLLIWAALAALVSAAFGAGAARAALALLALAGIYLPAVLLLSAAIEPSDAVERLLVAVGCPILAAATLLLVRGYAAVAIACAVTVLAYAIDVLLGSPLTILSLIGPNPGLGVRFFGIGNELEAVVATLVPIGVGAALTDARVGSPRAAAAAFAAAAALGIVVFAPGQLGADVGAAIVLSVGAAVAAWFVLGGGRRRLLLLAAPMLALAALLALELVLGGNAHLSRSVLEAGGLDDLADVVERRLRLSADSFARNVDSPSMLVCVALIVAGLIMRRRIAGWFEGRRAALAGLLGAVAATVVGTLSNDSGALLLMIGTGCVTLFVAFAWARNSGGLRV